MGSVERKLREKEFKREMILAAAMELFLNEGFENVSIRKIAEKIEYSPAAIYLHFKDKDELLHDLHIKGFEKLHSEQISMMNIENPLERLKQHGKVYMNFALKNPEYYDLMFIKRGSGKKLSELKEWDPGYRSYEMLRENVKECVDKGFFYCSDLDSATFALWSFVHGMASLIIRNRCVMIPGDKMEAVVEGSLKFMMENIASKKKIKLVYNE
jgi:AcrR family transcriptional regulator